jgi:hypothetical protein
MKYRKYRSADFLNAARLVRDVSRRYFHDDIKTSEGKKFWKDMQSLKKTNMPLQKKLFKVLPIKIVAEHNAKLAGIITGKPDEVIMLFVRPGFQKKGIAMELFSRFKKRAVRRNAGFIKVKSSRFAERFYQKAGFIRTGPEMDLHGLPAIPMKAKI